MSIDKELLDQLMEGRSSGDLFGKEGILAELTKALAERALTAEMEEHLGEERAEGIAEGQNHPPNRRNGTFRSSSSYTPLGTVASSSTRASCRDCQRRILEIFVLCQHRPDLPGHLVGQRDSDQHLGLARQQS